MFFEKIIRFIRGYVIITAKGKFPERFLNVCANKNILVSDVTYLTENCVKCRVSMKAYKELDAISKKTFVEVEVVSKGGFPVLLSKYKKRLVLLLTPLIFLLSLIILNLFVWDIEIIGCEKILPKTILDNLSELGVKTGVLRSKIDEVDIKSEMLMKMPELSWFWIDKRGSKLVVSIRESTPKPEMFDKNDYCNIIAQKDGVIDSVIVKSGSLMCELGDTVRKNDILVSGLMLSEKNIEPRKIQADAEIYARVWYEKTEKISLSEEKRTETGEISKRKKIKIFGWEFVPFWCKDHEFEDYTTDTSVFELNFLGKFMGIKVTTDVFKEYEKEIIPLEEATAVQSGVQTILEKIDTEALPNSARKDYTSSYVKNDDNTISVTVVCEYIENIAKKVRVE